MDVCSVRVIRPSSPLTSVLLTESRIPVTVYGAMRVGVGSGGGNIDHVISQESRRTWLRNCQNK